MGKTKQAHHRGTHQRRATAITQAAKANPATRCWRCNRTLEQVRQRKPNAIWTAGHLPGFDGIPDAPMAAECSPCNFGHGAALGNRRRGRYRPQPPIFRTSRSW